MNTKILIAEDKSLLAHDLVDRLNHFGYKNILGPYATGEEAYECSLKEAPDLALLDISLGGEMTGIQLAQRLNENAHVPVVYLTQHQDDRILEQTLPTFPVAYINKPFTNNELKMALMNAIKATGQPVERSEDEPGEVEALDDRIFIRNGRGKYFIKLDEILWIQSGGGETSTIMTKDRLEARSKNPPVVGHNLSRLEERLAFYPMLVRCSRYYIVNLKEVERIIDVPSSAKSKKALLVHGNEIAVGEKYRKDVLGRLRVV